MAWQGRGRCSLFECMKIAGFGCGAAVTVLMLVGILVVTAFVLDSSLLLLPPFPLRRRQSTSSSRRFRTIDEIEETPGVGREVEEERNDQHDHHDNHLRHRHQRHRGGTPPSLWSSRRHNGRR